jgi:hypothetical protein
LRLVSGSQSGQVASLRRTLDRQIHPPMPMDQAHGQQQTATQLH